MRLVNANKGAAAARERRGRSEEPRPAEDPPTLTDRQREIVTAAIGVIAKEGVSALTTRSLAEALGVTEPALYRHFRDKTDILLAILASFRSAQLSLHARIASGPASPLGKLEAMVGGVFRGFAAQPAMVSVILAEGMFQNEPRLSRAILGIMDDRKAHLAAFLAEGRSQGEIRPEADPEAAALLVMGGMRLLATRWRLSGLAFDLEAEGRELLKAVRRMLAAETDTKGKGG